MSAAKNSRREARQPINSGSVCLKKPEPILQEILIDRRGNAPAERSGAAEFPPHTLLPPRPRFWHCGEKSGGYKLEKY
ncbi:MAG: hypothetical protein Q8R40_02995 [bacterium]|nr:hypothetical protein [bacterium]